MNKYSTWSDAALQGYIVMLEAFMSGTKTESTLQDYKQKESEALKELNTRSIKEEQLAHPTETWVSGSVVQHS